LGNAVPFRISLAVWAIAWGIVACIAVRFLGFSVARYENGEVLTAAEFLSDIPSTISISLTAPLWALMGYSNNWVNPWAIDNCGDRLWQLMFGPRAVEIAPEEVKINVPDFDGMTPREVFGLGLHCTRRELNKARRRLVQELHPDRWQSARPEQRKAREEALKRVNAAHDALSPQAVDRGPIYRPLRYRLELSFGRAWA
jgi:hypothetical protein